MFLAVRYAPISSSAPRALGAAYVPILLSEVEQEQRHSENGDRQAIVVEAGLSDGEGERANTIYYPVLGGKKNLKGFKEQKPSKNGTIRSQNFRSIFDLTFRSHKSLIQKHITLFLFQLRLLLIMTPRSRWLWTGERDLIIRVTFCSPRSLGSVGFLILGIIFFAFNHFFYFYCWIIQLSLLSRYNFEIICKALAINYHLVIQGDRLLTVARRDGPRLTPVGPYSSLLLVQTCCLRYERIVFYQSYTIFLERSFPQIHSFRFLEPCVVGNGSKA